MYIRNCLDRLESAKYNRIGPQLYDIWVRWSRIKEIGWISLFLQTKRVNRPKRSVDNLYDTEYTDKNANSYVIYEFVIRRFRLIRNRTLPKLYVFPY